MGPCVRRDDACGGVCPARTLGRPGLDPGPIPLRFLVSAQEYGSLRSQGRRSKPPAGRSSLTPKSFAVAQSPLRCPGAPVLEEEREPSRKSVSRLRRRLYFALHLAANIAHGGGKVVLSLQVDPELRSVAEITAEAQCGLRCDRALAVQYVDNTA